MPYVIRKVKGKNCYSVKKKLIKNNKTAKRGRTLFSKCTSLKNAESQLRLLRAIEYGKNFVPRKSVKNRK
jgi:hypothetical protein